MGRPLIPSNVRHGAETPAVMRADAIRWHRLNAGSWSEASEALDRACARIVGLLDELQRRDDCGNCGTCTVCPAVRPAPPPQCAACSLPALQCRCGEK